MARSAMAGDGRRSRALRRRYGLTQAQFAAALGVAEKSLARLEGQAAWSPALARLLLLVERVPTAEAPKVFRALWKSPPVGAARLEPAMAETWSRDLALKAKPGLAELPLVEDSAEAGSGGSREWSYWATPARADQADTKYLADEYGVICRPFLDHRGEPALNIDRLAAGDMLLLRYDGFPQLWYEVQPARRAPPPGVEAGGLPRVFRFIPGEAPRGQAVRKRKYRHGAGRPPAEANYFFSCIRVRATRRPLREHPEQRPPGVRGTLTPYAFAG